MLIEHLVFVLLFLVTSEFLLAKSRDDKTDKRCAIFRLLHNLKFNASQTRKFSHFNRLQFQWTRSNPRCIGRKFKYRTFRKNKKQLRVSNNDDRAQFNHCIYSRTNNKTSTQFKKINANWKWKSPKFQSQSIASIEIEILVHSWPAACHYCYNKFFVFFERARGTVAPQMATTNR